MEFLSLLIWPITKLSPDDVFYINTKTRPYISYSFILFLFLFKLYRLNRLAFPRNVFWYNVLVNFLVHILTSIPSLFLLLCLTKVLLLNFSNWKSLLEEQCLKDLYILVGHVLLLYCQIITIIQLMQVMEIIDLIFVFT